MKTFITIRKRTVLQKLFFVIILLFSTNSIIAQISDTNIEELVNSKEWLNLLQIQEDGNSRIGDPNFFATSVPIDPFTELKFLVNNKSNQLINKFPARYQFISKHFDMDIDLMNSPKISSYLEEMQGDSISLFFVSPYMGSSMSYFGHTFLRLNKNDNEMFSKVINFIGHIPDDINFISLVKKGLFENLTGGYFISPFYKVFYKYAEKEQRLLIEYDLKFTNEEILKLLLHLYELQEIKIDYSFIFHNCSSGLVPLLQVAKPNLDLSLKFKTIVYPYDLPSNLVSSGLAKEKRTILPKIEKSFLVYKKLPLKDRASFFSLRNSKNKLNDLLETSSSNDNELRYLLSNYYDLRFKMKDQAFSDYKEVKSLVHENPIPFSFNTSQSLDNRTSNISYGITIKEETFKHIFSFSLLSTENISTSFSKLQIGFLEVGDIKFLANDQGLKLDALSLLNIESLNKINPFDNVPSKKIYIGFKRDINTEDLRFWGNLGLGVSFDFFSSTLFTFPQLTLTSNPFDLGFSVNPGLLISSTKFNLKAEAFLPLYSLNKSFTNKIQLTTSFFISERLNVEGSYNLSSNCFSISMNYLFR